MLLEVAGGDGDTCEGPTGDGAVKVCVGSVVVGAWGHVWWGVEDADCTFARINAEFGDNGEVAGGI